MTLRIALLALALVPGLLAQEAPDPIDTITPEEFLEHVKFLAADDLAGRDTGSDGERAAREYAIARFRELGLAPAGVDGTFEQAFPCDGLTGTNVLARFEGSDEVLRPEVVVLGAHYDHVGLGHFGSTWEGRGAGEIHNGADDNASGTAAILEIAEAFVEGRVRTKRSVIFMLFSGEERGLVGSKHFASHPTVPIGDVVAMINLDMVGRGVGVGRFMVLGTRTSPVFPGLVREVNERFEYSLDPIPFGYAPSDNTSFYEKGIPVFFLTTGDHPEYHNPDDDWPLINEENGAAVSRFAFELARRIADLDERPGFQQAELAPRSYVEGLAYLAKRALRSRRAHLGVELGEGMAVAEVVPGSAAERAGVEAGDVLVRLGDAGLSSGPELRRALADLAPGDRAALVVRRGSEEIELDVVLGTR